MTGPADRFDPLPAARGSLHRRHRHRHRLDPSSAGLTAGALVVALLGSGCLGARYQTNDPGPAALDRPTRAVVDLVTKERKAVNLPEPTLVTELRPVAARAALAVARGEASLKTAASAAAQDAVTETGRHAWAFVTECADQQHFRSPPMLLQQKTLLLGAAAVPGQAGRLVVLLVVAEAGPSSLRADRMGGGPGGTNPNVAIYAHPSVATGACGETWPAAPRVAF